MSEARKRRDMGNQPDQDDPRMKDAPILKQSISE